MPYTIKRPLKLLMGTLMLLVIHGCATHANFAKRYNGWIGKNITQFIAKEGYPDDSFTLPSKHKVYVYKESRIVSYPMIGFGYEGGVGGGYGLFGYGADIDQRVCKLFVETDPKGKILKWQSRGNACVSR